MNDLVAKDSRSLHSEMLKSVTENGVALQNNCEQSQVKTFSVLPVFPNEVQAIAWGMMQRQMSTLTQYLFWVILTHAWLNL